MSDAARALTTVPAPHQLSGELCRRDYKRYMREAWPIIEAKPLRWNWHLDAIAEHLLGILSGQITRLLVNVPPRTSKSLNFSVLLPTFSWIDTPELGWMTLAYAKALATRDTLKSRWLLESQWYQERWGDIYQLRGDQNRSDRYTNDCNGFRIASGLEGQVTGDGADIILVDDPHNMSEIHSDAERNKVLDIFDNVLFSRFNDANTGRMIVVGQRGHEMDLSGHIISTAKDWVHLNIPMEYDIKRRRDMVYFRDPRTKDKQLLDPARFPPAYITELKGRMTKADYQAQYQQDPGGGGGLILKSGDWRPWSKEEPPLCEMVIQSYDTAFEETEDAAWSARTTWGLFHKEGMDGYLEENLILLEWWEDKAEYPKLLREAVAAHKLFDADALLIEKKASGISLVQDLRRKRLPVRAIPVLKDKVARAHYASLMLEQGRVWFMDIKGTEWAKTVIGYCASFPRTDHVDTVDSVTQALGWLRRRVELTDERPDPDEELEREHDKVQARKRRGYG